eukprot:Em0009g426a
MASPGASLVDTGVSTPGSTSRSTRVQEKEQLQELNGRFVNYIEQVRKVKEEKLILEAELQRLKDQDNNEVDRIKALLENELADARALIDETAREKAQQQLQAAQYKAEADELKADVKELNEKFTSIEQKLDAAETKNNGLDAQLRTTIIERNKLQKQVKDYEAEIGELRERIEDLQDSFNKETLNKVALQNEIQTLKEEAAFNKKMHDEEVAALKNKLRGAFGDSTDFARDITQQLEAKLGRNIDDLRDRIEQEVAQHKKEMEDTYRDRINKLEDQVARETDAIRQLQSQLRELRGKLKDANDDVAQLQKENAKLEDSCRQKDNQLSHLEQDYGDQIGQLTEERRVLRQNYDEKLKEYEQLLGLKVQLDHEIATYRALLQEEENRLNITPSPPRRRPRPVQCPSSEPPPAKRSRVDGDDTSASVQISDVDPAGRFVQVKNMSNQGVQCMGRAYCGQKTLSPCIDGVGLEHLGAFRIVHSVEAPDGTKSETVFRFHHKSKLQAQAAVTVWASKAVGAIHTPPADIIWKGIEMWGIRPKDYYQTYEWPWRRGGILHSACPRGGELEPSVPLQEPGQDPSFLRFPKDPVDDAGPSSDDRMPAEFTPVETEASDAVWL